MAASTYIWEDLFADHILERGFDYYYDDYVAEITRQGDILSAGVFGTQLYRVTIRLQNDNPVKMACSCPYAADGSHCKHMAAVLYQWEEEREEEEDGDELDFLEDYVETFLAQAFHTPELLQRKLEYTADMCALFAKPQKPGVTYWSAGIWIERHLDLLEETGASEGEIVAFCREYWYTQPARQYVTDGYLNHGDYEAAAEVLLESMEMFGTRNQSGQPYDMQLLEVYQKSGQQEKYTSLLKRMVLEQRAGNMETYRMLKAQYAPEAWKDVLAELLDAPAWERYREQIYELEGMKGKLLEIVCRDGRLYTAEKYTEILKEDYPKELLDIYERELQKLAVYTAGRNAYREWAGTLQKMKEIPGGEERVQEILQDWRIRYSNRRAMMDELRRV